MPEVGISCVKGAKIIIIDDVLTSGKTVQQYVWKLESLGASVIGCMVVGKTV
jgi:adenine/guanine phosphoribosyltransferase-like PRPP-binding protein